MTTAPHETLDFPRLFNALPGCYVILDPSLTIVSVSEAYLQATSTCRQDILGRPMSEVFPDDRAGPSADGVTQLLASLTRVLQSGRADRMAIQKYDIRRPGEAGGGFEERYWSPLNTPVLAQNGSVSYLIHCVEDVTEIVRLKKQNDRKDDEIKQTDRRFAQLLDAAPDAMIVVQADGQIELVNEQTEQLFGYARAELVGAQLELLIPERLRGRHADYLAHFFALPKARPMGQGLELLARKQDGTEFPIEVSLSPLSSETGTTVSAAIRDITHRKRIEAELKLHADRFESAIESMQDAFALFDGQDRLLRCNAAYRELLSPCVAESLLGKTRAELIDLWLRQQVGELAGSAEPLRAQWLNSERKPMQAFELRTRDQRRLRVMDRPTSHGDLVEVIWDTTDDERRADELKLARSDAEAASKAKSEFLSSMSHELRTPMNAILGFGQLLMRDPKHPLSERQRERVTQILHGGQHLLRLIDDVLDLAKIESGRVSISAEPVSLSEVLAELSHTLKPMAQEHGIVLRAAPLAASFPSVVADRERLLQVLLNFGSNAIKYNRPHGQVTFRAEQNERAVRVVVEDNGIGIPLAQQAKIFQPFQRAGQEMGPIQGTGIGLTISRRLAELIGGEVGFRSAPGSGSAFWLQLPLVAATAASAEKRQRSRDAELGGSHVGLVLYIEDNPANIAFMRDLVDEIDGFRLITARTAEEGVLLARSLNPRVILMDINLPGMSGIEALQALRQREDTSAIPVVALTASATERERRHGLQAGFFRYLTKPVDIDELVSTLTAAASPSDQARVPMSPLP